MIKPKVNNKEAYRLFHEGTLAIARAEKQGIRVDTDYLDRMTNTLNTRIERLERKFKRTEFFKDWRASQTKAVNIYSGKQLSTFLYKIKRIKVKIETKSGGGATTEEALQQLNIKELDILIKIRKLKKMRDTYLGSFYREQVNGYIHPFFNLGTVTTYRSSSSNPNFQNIPIRDEEAMRVTRRALFPRPGHQLLELDYGQLEVRIAACYNHDPKLIHDIVAGDMHRDMAVEIFKIKNFDKSKPGHSQLRKAAKNAFVFPQFYGDYWKSCSEGLAVKWGELPETGKWKPGQGIDFEGGKLSDHLINHGFRELGKIRRNEAGRMTPTQFRKHIQDIEYDFWNNRYSVYKNWKDGWWHRYQKRGYIDTFTGFRFTGVMDRKQAINYPIQGSAFHCLLWSFIELDRVMRTERWDTRIIGQIHDSIILDVHPAELSRVMQVAKRITTEDLPKAWTWITVPLEIGIDLCEIDQPWSEKKELEFV